MAGPVLILVDIAHRGSAIALLKHAKVPFDRADLHVAYVMPYGFYSYVEPFVSEESQRAAAARAKAELAAILVKAGLQDVAKPHVLRGGIGEQSLRLADKLQADFIVLNAIHQGSTHTTLGTNAAQISRHARCSVCIMRR